MGRAISVSGHPMSEMAQTAVSGADAAPGSGGWLGATVGAGLRVARLGLLAPGVGALLRHSAGAVATMRSVVPLAVVVSNFMLREAPRPVREKLIEYTPLNGPAFPHPHGRERRHRPAPTRLLAVVTRAVTPCW